MIEAATGVSVPLIAIILILQLVLPHFKREKEVVAPSNGKKAVMAHQITEIDQRTEKMVSAIDTLNDSLRGNTKAVERLTEKIDDTRP